MAKVNFKSRFADKVTQNLNNKYFKNTSKFGDLKFNEMSDNFTPILTKHSVSSDLPHQRLPIPCDTESEVDQKYHCTFFPKGKGIIIVVNHSEFDQQSNCDCECQICSY